MLELRNIRKIYPAGNGEVEALKGIDLSFRESEFVSILGPSGCGKTTMLNIIGGLDKYTDGDLIIDGISTKQYKDRDWDTYRNHSIGFVFQSYNLIPHQTVLQNVELALTLSGVGKSERTARAKKALEEVGLGDQLSKKPNEMSGGQMQRVAIARALVNSPDIILADEPTGALDTETSVQVMEILKSISKDRLIIMVTHNPDLAKKYSSRIITMLDGVITDDSAPLSNEEYNCIKETEKAKISGRKKVKKPSMSFATSFMLSLKNLFTKKGRTALTSFAGSIGIIGIALIFAVSQGTTAYIDIMQEEALSSSPMTIEKKTVDIMSLLETFVKIQSTDTDHETDAVYKKESISKMIKAIKDTKETENDLFSFNEYLKAEMANEDSSLGNAISGIQYTYGLDLLVYTENANGEIVHSDTEELLTEILLENLGIDMSSASAASSASPMASMFSSGGSGNLWQELLGSKDGSPVSEILKKQYDVIYGAWPEKYNEIVLVVDENNELDDMSLYALGLLSKDDIDAIINSEGIKDVKWSYEDICNKEFRTILNADCYGYDETSGIYTDLRKTETGLRYLYGNGMRLKVTGIIRPSENAETHMLTGSIGYTSLLTKYLLEKAEDSEAVKAQLNNKTTDILTGLPFKSNTGNLSDEEKEKEFLEYIGNLDEKGKAEAYLKIIGIPPEDTVKQQIDAYIADKGRAEIESMLVKAMAEQMSIGSDKVAEYLAAMSDDELTDMFTGVVTEQIKRQYAQQASNQTASMTVQQKAAALEAALKTFTREQCASFYDSIMTFSESTYDDNLADLGYISLDDPASVSIYASTFENKDIITDAIETYNESVDAIKRISYTDYVGIIMSSMTSIINAVTYVLIAFVAISLIVSSIMIGVITLISVQERTKEIGILRAIGASKRDVSGMFNAETVIIGFTSGLLGVVVTYLLCIPINMILYALTGIASLRAFLPASAAAVLILISMLLTLISGIIPSRSAAKKDPVSALRTE